MRGAESVGLLNDKAAPRVEPLNGHREGEAKQQPEHCALDAADLPLARRVVRRVQPKPKRKPISANASIRTMMRRNTANSFPEIRAIMLSITAIRSTSVW